VKFLKGLTLAAVVAGLLKGLVWVLAMGTANIAGREVGKIVYESSQDAYYAGHLSELAAAINNKLTLPQTRTNPAGENIRIEPVTAGENALNYSYTILDYTAEQLSDGGFDSARYMQENLPGQRSNACADKGTRKIPERGIRLHYAYSSKDGQRMVAYDILPADCDFKG
jgi:hypothetical protein